MPREPPTESRMNNYESNLDLAALAAALSKVRAAVVLSHAKPDGDALGSCLAVRRLLAAHGAKAAVVLVGPIDPALRSTTEDEIESIDPKADEAAVAAAMAAHAEVDAIVVVDTGTFPQIEPLAGWVRDRRERVIGIDHHARGDEAAAALRYVDASAASTTEILAALAVEMGVPLTPGGPGSLAEAIFMGLATDTGWFRFPSAGPRQFALASRLLEAGVDKNRLYALLEQQGRPERLEMLGRGLASMRLVPWGGDRRLRFAVMHLRTEDFRATGAASTDVSGLVNEPLSLAGVVASVMLSEPEPGLVRMSFRSAGAAAVAIGSAACDGAAIDVNELASRFGGGGHVAAAGARMATSMDEAISRVTAEIEQGARSG